MNRNLAKLVLSNGGTITPLMIDAIDSNGLGLMNPSIFVDGDELMMILRNVNYTLYHCENEQIFNNRYGPLSYLNPENDIHLRTTNFLCKLDKKTLAIKEYHKIDTTKLDVTPIWEFVGLEDARLVRWNGKLYGIGVRRDTTTNGQGRMELSELEVLGDSVTEINRYRIEPPIDPNSYCEKNWMPVLDMPFHFVKWTNPAEVVKVDIETKTSVQVHLKEEDKLPDLPFLRGSSQVIRWGNYRICLVHDCDLFHNKLKQKDATYMHRFVVWDMDWKVVNITEPFSFMDGEIEFCCGMAVYNSDLLITFGFQDNAAYILRAPRNMIHSLLEVGTPFDWGLIETNEWFRTTVDKEIFVDDVYQKLFKVEEGDIVLDIGASVGPFTYSILNNNPSKVICLEPHKGLFPTLVDNLSAYSSVTCINKGISDVDDKFTTNNLFDQNSGLISDNHVIIDGIKFSTLVKDLPRVDFLKTDCEGGEYSIFTKENLPWIKENVRKISGEFHLLTLDEKAKFVEFRDTYLVEFTNFQVYSADGINIKWDVWNQHFIDRYYNVMVYIDNRGQKWANTNWPSLEITTSIPKNGCPVNCTFCPQQTLSCNYTGTKVLSLSNFMLLLDKVPKEITIVFAGFTEPFLNKSCADMIVYAHESGHKVAVFTSGIGLTIQDIDKIKHIPFKSVQGGFVLHLPDVEGYTSHKYPKNGLDMLRHLKDSKLNNFAAVSMGTVPEEYKEIFPEAHKQSMWSRAGNLNKEVKPGLTQDMYRQAPVSPKISTCNCLEKVYHNVLLPDGRVSLCCMDYGLENILGNLYEKTYEEIIPVTDAAFEICRYCENGKEL